MACYQKEFPGGPKESLVAAVKGSGWRISSYLQSLLGEKHGKWTKRRYGRTQRILLRRLVERGQQQLQPPSYCDWIRTDGVVAGFQLHTNEFTICYLYVVEERAGILTVNLRTKSTELWEPSWSGWTLC